ncbi:MAG: YbhB/YbcL family Raf kinase inhibitor-like protein [Bacillota bacterium]
MRNLRSVLILSLCLGAGTASAEQAFQLKSADIQNNRQLHASQVYQGFGCSGDNQSPQLEWSGAPAATKSFAVTMYDPDASTGSGWWHWVVYDIPASVHMLAGGAGHPGKLPDGARHGRNDFGSMDFGGACPPAGDKPHRYVVTVYALKTDKLGVPADASPAMIGFMLNSNRLGTASLTGMYGR